jgi:ribosomal protein S18 acetylase RimI-like enzyme
VTDHPTGPITPVAPDDGADLDAVLDLIADEQADHSRGTTMLGEKRDGVAAELADLRPDWGTTVRVARGDGRPDGRPVGASLVEWDEESARAWVFGPWVAGDDEAWRRWARPLLDAALAQLPAGIDRVELAGEVANVRMAALADELGWSTSEVSHVYAAGEATLRAWPDPVLRIRQATAADRETIRPAHDQEFPATYAPVERLLPDEPDGRFHVILAEDGPRFLGYAAGQVHPDGQGYLDYIAVPDVARGQGAGRDLLVAIGRWLVDAAPQHDLHLTVQDHRAPARRLYESLGLTLELSIVGYGRPKSG